MRPAPIYTLPHLLPRGLWLGLLALCGLLGIPAPKACAQNPSPPAFDWSLEAPDSVRPTLLRHLDLARFATAEELSRSEIQRLAQALPANAQRILGALGHFRPRVEVSLHFPEHQSLLDSAARANSDTRHPPPARPHVHVRIDPGPQARIASVHLYGLPPPDTAAAQAEWGLPPGEPFTQAAWDSAKADALARLTRWAHPAARIVGSLADVDTEQDAVHLHLELDPGPAYRFGPPLIEGLTRYDPQWVQRLLALDGVVPGATYDLSRLQAAQQRLAQSGYFETVYVHLDPADPPETAPVRVHVREWPRGRLVLGIGASTDLGPRLSLEHTHRRLPVLDAQLQSRLQLQRHTRSLGLDLLYPISASGWQWGLGLQDERLIDNATLTRNRRLILSRSQDGQPFERRLALHLDHSSVQPHPLPPGMRPAPAEQAISVHHRWHMRRWQPLPFPSEGHALGLEAGVGWVTQPRSAPFGRLLLSGHSLHPLASAESGRLALRAQVGAVWAAPATRIPDPLLFAAGGDPSVRGWAPRSIAIVQSDGSLRGGRYLLAASLEWQRPWLRGSHSDPRATPWENALFVDSAAVADRPAQLRARWGVGAGVRYRTPVGPIQADLAYALPRHRWRLHLSLGFVL